MRRPTGSARVVHIVWAALLAAPALLGVVRLALPHVSSAPDRDAALPPNAAELAARLEAAHADLEALRTRAGDERHARLLADVLLARDPSPRRSSLLAGVRSSGPVGSDVAALAPDGALVGRVVDVFPPAFLDAPIGEERYTIAQIQLLSDPGFRVRFTGEGCAGLLAGTGLVDATGAALLEIRYLEGPDEPPAGTRLVVDGRSGIYPHGVPIGTIVDDRDAELATRAGRHPLVRADAHLAALRRVVLTPDLMASSYSEASIGRAGTR